MSADLQDQLIKQLKKQRPKEGSETTFEVSRTSVDVLSKVKYVLRTGLEPLDVLSGGGLPFGRIVEVFGLESCGKSALMIRSAVKAQTAEIYERAHQDDGTYVLTKVDPKRTEVAVLFIDNEQSLDDEDSKLMVDGTKIDVIGSRCDTIDQIFKMVDIVVDKVSAQQAEEFEKAKKEKRDPVIMFVVIIIDTIAGTSSKEEMKEAWDKDDYPRQPKQLRQAFRVMQRKVNRHNVLMICTNQVSSNFQVTRRAGRGSSVPQDDDFSTFGGKALKYYATLRLFMACIRNQYRVCENRFSQGLLINCYTSKNRLVKPFRTARLVLLFDGGYHNEYSKLETLIYLGLVTISKTTGSLTVRLSKTGAISSGPSALAAGQALEALSEGKAPDDVELASRADWLPFCDTHPEDVAALWRKAETVLFADQSTAEADDDEDDIISDD